MKRHIMIDNETFGTRKNAVVVSVGAVAFDLDGTIDLNGGLHYALNIDEQLAAGRSMNASTLKWWLEQSELARVALVKQMDRAVSVSQFMDRFDAFVSYYSPQVKIWCKGANFDIALLDSLYEHAGRKRPYGYNATGDTRSFEKFYTLADNPPDGIYHDALSDAVWQAQQLQNLCRRMGWTEL